MKEKSKGIDALISLWAPGSMFRPTSSDIKKIADELLQEGESGSQALSVLIHELLACRSREITITYALWVAGQVLPTPELIRAVRDVTEASELTEYPTHPRFTPEIVGGGRAGWTSGTHHYVVRTARESLELLEGARKRNAQASQASAVDDSVKRETKEGLSYADLVGIWCTQTERGIHKYVFDENHLVAVIRTEENGARYPGVEYSKKYVEGDKLILVHTAEYGGWIETWGHYTGDTVVFISLQKEGSSGKEDVNIYNWKFWRFGRMEEDPTIYGDEMSGLRDRLRENKGMLPCLNCGGEVRVDLRAIEDEIKRNKALADSKIGAGRVLIIAREPGEKRLSVCKTCKDVLCDSCTKKAFEEVGQPGRPLTLCCPKCGHGVELIDHITD